ncbi:hypothetical protein COV11_03630 [Candidatus Woesearchaeota archaeon CG10_big_fil_rev_8_21_14_0_10_30_7]|nr:MAG: hypothetical protein COV11_03630 [Candidatus Woesearchaeota archaeon CG10_big_fil_rev_8_21_14_0_10_30_7]
MDLFKKIKKEELRTQRDAINDKLEGLQSILGQYRSNDYESNRSYFTNSLDLDNLLIGYLLGRSSQNEVWRTISSEQRFKPKPQPVYTPSYSGSFSSGGGFGGGGFSSGGGF